MYSVHRSHLYDTKQDACDVARYFLAVIDRPEYNAVLQDQATKLWFVTNEFDKNVDTETFIPEDNPIYQHSALRF